MLIICVTGFSLLKEVAMTSFSLHFEQETVLSKYSVNTGLKYFKKILCILCIFSNYLCNMLILLH